MKVYRYIAGCILDEDRSDALVYIEELLFMAHPYERELLEAFDGYAESYAPSKEDPADKDDRLYHEGVDIEAIDRAIHNNPLGVGFAQKDKKGE